MIFNQDDVSLIDKNLENLQATDPEGHTGPLIASDDDDDPVALFSSSSSSAPHGSSDDVMSTGDDVMAVTVSPSLSHLGTVPTPASVQNEHDATKSSCKRPRSLLSAANITPESTYTAPVESFNAGQSAEKACVICMNAPRQVVFNCSHCVSCPDCAEQITRCPMCRSPISTRRLAPAEVRRAVGFASCMPHWQQTEQKAKVEEDENRPAAVNSFDSSTSPAPVLSAALQPGSIPREPRVVHIIIALDRSGSMAGRRQEMLNSVNEFIRQQKQLQRDQPSFQESRMTVFLFDQRPSFTFTAQPLMECRELTLADYVVNGGTALYDSLMVLFRKFRLCESAIVAVITDGEDTCSRVFTRSQVASAIARIRRTLRWHFHYLCVDVEGAVQGRALGFDTTTEVRPERLAGSVSHNLSSEVAASRTSMSSSF